MLRCRESWIVKHAHKVHLPKSSWCPQLIPRLLPPTTESSPQSCLTLYLRCWVILLSFFLDNIGQDFPFVDKQFWNWWVQHISNERGTRVCVFQQLMLRNECLPHLLEGQIAEQGPGERLGRGRKSLGTRIDSKVHQDDWELGFYVTCWWKMFVPLDILGLPGILSVVSGGLKLVMPLSWQPKCWDYMLSHLSWLGYFSNLSNHLFCRHSGPREYRGEETQPRSEEFTTQNIIG